MLRRARIEGAARRPVHENFGQVRANVREQVPMTMRGGNDNQPVDPARAESADHR